MRIKNNMRSPLKHHEHTHHHHTTPTPTTTTNTTTNTPQTITVTTPPTPPTHEISWTRNTVTKPLHQEDEDGSLSSLVLVRLRGVLLCVCTQTAIRCSCDNKADSRANASSRITKTQKLDRMSRCLRSRSTSEPHQIIVRIRGRCVHCVTVQRLKHNLADRLDRSRFAPS